MAPPYGYGSREELEAAEAANRAAEERDAAMAADSFQNYRFRRPWRERSPELKEALRLRELEDVLSGQDRGSRRPPPPPESLGGPARMRGRRPPTDMYMKQAHDPYRDERQHWSSSGDPRENINAPETRDEYFSRRAFEIEKIAADEDFQQALKLVRMMKGTPPGSEVYETGPGGMRDDKPGIPFFRKLSPDYSPDWRDDYDRMQRWREAGSPPIR